MKRISKGFIDASVRVTLVLTETGRIEIWTLNKQTQEGNMRTTNTVTAFVALRYFQWGKNRDAKCGQNNRYKIGR